MTLISVVSATAWPSLGVGLNLSTSAPRGIYRAVANAPVRGALATACLPLAIAVFGSARGYLGPGNCPGGAQPVLKTIGAVGGDVVDLNGETVSVNSVPVLTRPIEIFDSAGRPLPHVTFGSYRVPDGQIWLFGLSQGRSWDSRYFGPVSLTAMRSMVRPVLVVDRGITQ